MNKITPYLTYGAVDTFGYHRELYRAYYLFTLPKVHKSQGQKCVNHENPKKLISEIANDSEKNWVRIGSSGIGYLFDPANSDS